MSRRTSLRHRPGARSRGRSFFYEGIGTEAGAFEPTPKQRLLLELTRDSSSITGRRRQEAVCSLARALASFELHDEAGARGTCCGRLWRRLAAPSASCLIVWSRHSLRAQGRRRLLHGLVAPPPHSGGQSVRSLACRRACRYRRQAASARAIMASPLFPAAVAANGVASGVTTAAPCPQVGWLLTSARIIPTIGNLESCAMELRHRRRLKSRRWPLAAVRTVSVLPNPVAGAWVRRSLGCSSVK